MLVTQKGLVVLLWDLGLTAVVWWPLWNIEIPSLISIAHFEQGGTTMLEAFNYNLKRGLGNDRLHKPLIGLVFSIVVHSCSKCAVEINGQIRSKIRSTNYFSVYSLSWVCMHMSTYSSRTSSIMYILENQILTTKTSATSVVFTSKSKKHLFGHV